MFIQPGKHGVDGPSGSADDSSLDNDGALPYVFLPCHQLISDPAWVLGGRISIPQLPLTLFCCCTHASCGGVGVWLCVSFSWPWPAISCCSCQLLAQLHSTIIALPCRATGPRARPHSALGDLPFLPAPLNRPSAQMVYADIRGDKASSHRPNLDSGRCSVILLGCRMEMDCSPERADAVVTCASPLPVAQPVTPDWLTTGEWGR